MYAPFSSTLIAFSAALHFSSISISPADPLRSFALQSHADVPPQEIRKRLIDNTETHTFNVFNNIIYDQRFWKTKLVTNLSDDDMI